MPYRNLIAIAAAFVFTGTLTAAGQTWSGKISDSACGAKHDSGGEMGEDMNDKDCTNACVRGGSKYVLVVDGKVYRIANQDAAGLRDHAGEAVRVTGDLKGDAITITKIDPTK